MKKTAAPIFTFDEPVYLLPTEISVNGKKIDAPYPYIQDGVLMVPLRAVAEALGYTVRWESVTQSIMLNNVISLQIGKDYYTLGRMAPITLGVLAPVLTEDGHTYVPLEFFTKVAGVTEAYTDKNQLIINRID